MEHTETKEKKGARLRAEVREKTLGYLLAALGLVAGLAWNDAISELIKQLFPLDQGTLVAKFVYAAIITLAVVFASTTLLRVFGEKK